MAESWAAELEAGDPDAAWDHFIDSYRRLIFGAIRHYVAQHDDVMDVFAWVCEALRANDYARFRRCAAHVDPARPFSTWLTVVVRNLTIDWLRQRDGRRRVTALVASLPPLQQRIFTYVFLEECSHLEAYAMLQTRDGFEISFRDFQRELIATYRAARESGHGRLLADLAGPTPVVDPGDTDPAVVSERKAILTAALESLSPDERLAVQLYVVEEMPADQVARALGYPNAKAVYNRVYRALAAIRDRLARMGVTGGDL